MHTFENTFIRGPPSPTYSDEGEGASSSDNNTCGFESAADNFLNEKCNASPQLYYSRQRGGGTIFAFWTIITVLLLLTVGNLILTLTLMGVLDLGKGIRGVELIPEEGVIKFYGITDLDRIYNKIVGIFSVDGFTDIPVTITGDDGDVFVRILRNGQPYDRLILNNAGIQLRGINSFEIKDARDGANIFTTHRPHYNMPKGAESLIVKTVSASRIASPIADKLRFEADSRITIRGSEGISTDSGSVLLQAEHNIVINSTDATILEGGVGIYLDMDKMPIVSSEFGLRTGNVQYKLCVCMPAGILFRIPIPRVHNGPKITCTHFTSIHEHDPCSSGN